jgi:uncharacterized membrane protein YphA (DoxX/SURF4 family)
MNFNRILTAAARILMGLLFAFSGLNGFLQLTPMSTEGMPEGALAFSTALGETGYMMQLTMGVELVVGVLLLVNRFVPLALASLAPVVVNIVLFHVFLAPAGTVMALVIAAAEVYLAWAYRDAFRPMLRASMKAPATTSPKVASSAPVTT